MSFVQQLASQTRLTQEAWVQEQVNLFKEKCWETSWRSRASCEMDCRAIQPRCRKLLAQELRAQLVPLGFSSLQVFPTFNCIKIKASWDEVEEAEAAEAPKVPKDSARGCCGICLEQAALSALAPCGHTICQGCLKNELRKCPFCRQPVEAATNGLFIG
ncbi:unnamed protein product [Effrenium voratum]|uniref:RING-type domain-containing protein n=1 Tax=Effrenium voratum TaxID=2562239 RepID=A0AA36JJR7_9DINO|nr:unnamed protein product [Effrenium voratum]